MDIFTYSLCTGHRVDIDTKYLHTHLKTTFFVVQDSSVGHVNAEPHWLSKLGSLRDYSSGSSFESWGAR